VNGKSGDGEIGSGQAHDLPYPSDSDFIHFAATWTPERIDYFINGELVRTIDEGFRIPTHPQRIFFSLWGSETLTDWMGTFAPPDRPIQIGLPLRRWGKTASFPSPSSAIKGSADCPAGIPPGGTVHLTGTDVIG
jgi:endo-1,3-1,4-beta-glycanase ExoK